MATDEMVDTPTTYFPISDYSIIIILKVLVQR